MSEISAILNWLEQQPLAAEAIGVLVLALLAYLTDKIAKRIVIAIIGGLIRRTSFTWDDVLHEHKVFERLAHLAPALALYYGVTFIPGLPDAFTLLVQRAAQASMVLIGVGAAGAFLSASAQIYSTSPVAEGRPIKGYVQIAKIILYVLGLVVVVATLMGKSPLLFFSGIGAMTAILLLIFRDTLLSFVASLQVASYDIVRVGDWIEMPQFGADGDVVDVSLHTIKVQNWDKTVTTIPTRAVIEGSVKNWRGMSESGGRRIKRSFYIDMNTIRFLDEADIARFERFALLKDYVQGKKAELTTESTNEQGDPDIIANSRRLTNIGTLRAYIVNYMRTHPKVHKGMTLLVRQRNPTANGLPIEIYVFSSDIDWIAYEGIQSDIFDHILAVVPEFGLRLFQLPAGRDLEAAFSNRSSDRSAAAF